MRTRYPRRERGQALITVAICMVVLLLFAALAIDVGQMYTQRRHMQNAADAGALAGARELCLGHTDITDIENMATEYAGTLNGAPLVTVTVESNIVAVTAAIPVTNVFARLIGVNTTLVHADAKAACGAATKGCGIFPVAFDIANWTDIACNQKFILFEDSNFPTQAGLCDNCDCGGEDYYSGSMQIGPGNRGWLRLPLPAATGPFPDPADCGDSCGSALKCWVAHDWPGQVAIGQCIPGKPGVDEDALTAAEERVNDIVTVPLWNTGTCTSVIGSCPGTNYRVAGFACLRIERVYDKKKLTLYRLDKGEGGPLWDKNFKCPKNTKAIIATKLCDCDMSACGATSGEPIPPYGVGAVSLIE